LEIGGGGGSIAEWLCRQVGSSGHVVATEIEPRFLEAIKESNLDVWRHDIIQEPLPEQRFTLCTHRGSKNKGANCRSRGRTAHGSPTEFIKLFEADAEKWAKVIRAANIKLG
jgi:hypothetical protein